MSRERAITAEIPRLRRYARALTGNPAEADDLVQDCLERALRAMHQWTEGENPRRWLFAIMHNLFIDAARRSARRPQIAPVDLAETAGEAPALDNVDSIALRRALAALSPEHREVVLLVGLEGLSYREAAEALDIRIGTLMSRLARGRERLRDLMASEQSAVKSASIRRVK